MRPHLTMLFLLLTGTLLVKQARAAVPPRQDQNPKRPPPPITNNNKPGGVGIGSPAAPAAPAGKGNEAEIQKEGVDYSAILGAVSSLLDAVTSAISELDSGSSTTVSAPLPTAARPCYSVSSIYNHCALHNSTFQNVSFPVQASCLCYRSRANNTAVTWVPSSYDGYMSSCNDYAQTQTLASSITAIGNKSSDFNLCSSAGDVRATPGLVSPSSTATTTATPASSPTTPSAAISTSTSGSPYRSSALGRMIVCIGLWFLGTVI